MNVVLYRGGLLLAAAGSLACLLVIGPTAYLSWLTLPLSLGLLAKDCLR